MKPTKNATEGRTYLGICEKLPGVDTHYGPPKKGESDTGASALVGKIRVIAWTDPPAGSMASGQPRRGDLFSGDRVDWPPRERLDDSAIGKAYVFQVEPTERLDGVSDYEKFRVRASGVGSKEKFIVLASQFFGASGTGGRRSEAWLDITRRQDGTPAFYVGNRSHPFACAFGDLANQDLASQIREAREKMDRALESLKSSQERAGELEGQLQTCRSLYDKDLDAQKSQAATAREESQRLKQLNHELDQQIHQLQEAARQAPALTSLDFIQERLEASLGTWVPEATQESCTALHLALLGCRAVIVPDSTWAPAYAAAMGLECRLHTAYVAPDWNCPSPLEAKLHLAWDEALRCPAQACLLQIVNADLALIEDWGEELLNLLVDGLHSLGRTGLPRNLRIVVSPSADSSGRFLPRRLLGAFAAVGGGDGDGPLCLAAPLPRGTYVPGEDWLSWVPQGRSNDRSLKRAARQEARWKARQVPQGRSSDRSLESPLGLWSDLAAREHGHLRELANAHELEDSIAHRIRFEYPKEYVRETSQAY